MALKRKSKNTDDGDAGDDVDAPNEWTVSGIRSDGVLVPTGLQAVDAPPQPSYLGPLLVTMICCLPLGFISILYAIQVPIRWRRGDQSGSRHCAERAEFWMYASVGASVVLWAIYGMVWFFYLRNQSPYT